MHRWAPSRSLEILFQRLLTLFGWGMAVTSLIQLVLRVMAPPSPQREALIWSAGLATPFWTFLTFAYRSRRPSRAVSDAFGLGAMVFVSLQLTLVTWFVRDPLRIAAYFTPLAVAGVFVRRGSVYAFCLGLVLSCTSLAWWLAPPPPSSALWLGTQLLITLAVGLLLHEFVRQLMDRVGRLLLRLVEARRAVAELRGLIPICAACKSVRNDKGFWETVETYVERQTHSTFTHGLCPNCLAEARAQFHRELEARPPAADLSLE
ncbi:MAG TPA: hypothetical protein VJ570_02480 [Holophagaceae bacterium]|nr:hypothetical protein [Holophagaceae bacterium]